MTDNSADPRLDQSRWRSLLFVPGARPDRFEKAAQAGADLVCIDLEDAVAPAGKDDARAATLRFLAEFQDRTALVGLRINAIGSDVAEADLAGLHGAQGVDFVMVPKISGEQDLAPVVHALPHTPIIPVVESARGVQNVEAIADHEAVTAAIYGAIDLSADIGATLEWEAHLYGRSRCAMAFGAARKVLFDTPYLDVADDVGLVETTKRAKALGIPARAAIHPKQLGPIHSALAPDPEEIAWAERIVAAFEAAEDGLAMVDGKLIELPVIKSAHRILATARR